MFSCSKKSDERKRNALKTLVFERFFRLYFIYFCNYYFAVQPPSIINDDPVIIDEAFEAR